VDVTVSKVEADPVTVNVARDDAALAKLGSDLVAQLNLVLGEIGSQTASKSATDASGRTVITGGPLSGNGTVRMLSQDLLNAGSRDVNGVSASSIGISVDKFGVFSFDETKFKEALAADPAKVQEVLTALGGRVDAVAVKASDKYDGTLTQLVNSSNQQIGDLDTRITRWDTILTNRRASLERQWAALETALSRLQGQSNWLTNAISSLPQVQRT
jgi:flagellar hook-associated protein 2